MHSDPYKDCTNHNYSKKIRMDYNYKISTNI